MTSPTWLTARRSILLLAALQLMPAACALDEGEIDSDEGSDLETQEIAGRAFYVDCNGSDSKDGRSPTTAWRTLSRASSASLAPGDGLLLRRGCTFAAPLRVAWNGTSSAPISIGAYGSGDRPLVRGDAGGTDDSVVAIQITGSYLVVEDLRAQIANPVRDSSCRQADGTAIPLGWYVGFNVTGHHNLLRRIDVSSAALGIDLTDASDWNQVTDSSLHDLHMLWRLSRSSGALGALGVNLHGDDNELARNVFRHNTATCTFSDGVVQTYSAPIELFNANRSMVHHNRAYGHRKHFEMGHDSSHTANDNLLAYNLFVSDVPSAVGPNVHGQGNPFGPVNRTLIVDNTIVFTGANSQAITCDCSGGATLQNNIFVAEWKAAYYKGSITENHNLYWDLRRTSDSSADPNVQFSAASVSTISSTSLMVDPKFVDAAGGDLRLSSASAAIDAGVESRSSTSRVPSLLKVDLDGASAPQGSARDIGGYETP